MPVLLSLGVKTLWSNRNECGMAFLLQSTLFAISQCRDQFCRKFSRGRSCCTVVGAGEKGELCSK